MLQALIAGEETVLLWIQDNIRNEWLTPFVIFITNLGNGGFIWLLGSAVLLIPKQTRSIYRCGIAVRRQKPEN